LKKSGEFERLRRELLTQFQQDESYTGLKARVEATGRERLAANPTLRYMPPETIQEDLTQELQRHPIIERAVADVRVFSDPAFLASTKASIKKILDDERAGFSGTPKGSGNAMADIKFTPSDAKQDEKHSAQAGPSGQNESVNELTSAMKTSISTESKPSVESPGLSSTTPFLPSVSPSQAPSSLEPTRLSTAGQSPPGLDSTSNPAPSSSTPPTGNLNINMTIGDPPTTDVEMVDIRPGD